MRRPDKEPEEPLLFDLPLDSPAQPRTSPEPDRKRAAPGEGRARRPDPEPALAPVSAVPPGPQPVGSPLTWLSEPSGGDPRAATLSGERGAARGQRVLAGLADLLVLAAVTVGVLLGARSLGCPPAWQDWPAIAVFALSFSFLYAVVPLAFWGHTPGMAWAGLLSQNRDGEPLTFDQTARLWFGGLLSLVMLGLPLLLTFRGRALSDFLSGSETRSMRAPGIR